MHIAIMAEPGLRAVETPSPRSKANGFGRWLEVAMLAAAILVAPVAFLVGLVIYAVRRHIAR
jgi:hypothetical protein